MVQISINWVLTYAGQPVGSSGAHMWANMWAHYWFYTNGISYQRVTHTPKFMQTHNQIVCIIMMAKDAWKKDDKGDIFCSVVPNFDSLLHITSLSWSNSYWHAILHHRTIKPKEYTCYYSQSMLPLFNSMWPALNWYNKMYTRPHILDLAWCTIKYQIGPWKQ